jgi:hypothetical protein
MAWDAAFVTLGQQLYYLRDAAGMTLTEAARRLGVTKGHLSSVEHGRAHATARIVEFYEEQFHGEGQARGLYTAAKTAPQPPQRRPLAERPPYPIPGDAATFVADRTIPDGTVMLPYHKFEKVWRIRNSGTVPWVGRWLARRGTPWAHGLPKSPHRVRIPDTQPGEEVNIKVPMQAQALAGSSQAHFKMVDDDDWQYFPDDYPVGIVLSIEVVEKAPGPDLPRSA